MSYKVNDYPLNFKVTYILKLEDDCWYVGRMNNGLVDKRINQHFTSYGAGWTHVHKPIAVHAVLAGDREKEVTKTLIKRHGKDKVRGSDYVKVKAPSWKPQPTMHGCITN